MDHQVEHDGDVRSARAERGETLAVDEPRLLDVRQRGSNSPIESLYMPDLDHHAILLGQRQQGVCLLQRRRDGLFDEYMLAAPDRLAGHGEVCGGRNDDDDRIRLVE